MRTSIHTYVCTRTCTMRTHACMQPCIHPHILTHAYACIYIYTQDTPTRICIIHMHACIAWFTHRYDPICSARSTNECSMCSTPIVYMNTIDVAMPLIGDLRPVPRNKQPRASASEASFSLSLFLPSHVIKEKLETGIAQSPLQSANV
jgi:hypothetical protein